MTPIPLAHNDDRLAHTLAHEDLKTARADMQKALTGLGHEARKIGKGSPKTFARNSLNALIAHHPPGNVVVLSKPRLKGTRAHWEVAVLTPELDQDTGFYALSFSIVRCMLGEVDAYRLFECTGHTWARIYQRVLGAADVATAHELVRAVFLALTLSPKQLTPLRGKNLLLACVPPDTRVKPFLIFANWREYLLVLSTAVDYDSLRPEQRAYVDQIRDSRNFLGIGIAPDQPLTLEKEKS